MRVVHIPAYQDLGITITEEALDGTPEHLTLFLPVQHMNELERVKEQLEEAGKTVELLQTRHTWNPGQILGCNNERYDIDGDAFLYVGDGLFHPKALVMKNDEPVYCFNPRTDEFFLLDQDAVKEIRQQVKAARKVFFTTDSVGVLVTTKTGQRGLKYKWAKKLDEKYEDKKFYYILQNNIDFQELGNFPFIDVFLNTACERIGYDDAVHTDHHILNVEDVDDEVVEEFPE